MKKIFFIYLLLKASSLFAQDPNILIGMDIPSYGITTKINFPGYTGGYSRAYSFSNEDISKSFLSFGVLGSVLNGKSSMTYGYIGTGLSNPFMSFLPNGNVGIGTINNTYKLNVNGPTMINGALISSVTNQIGGVLELHNPTKTASQSSSIWRLYNMGGSYGNSLQFWAYSDLSCENGGLCANRFTIMDNGNVGIGITAPAEKLAVNGKIRAQEIKVEATNWPDYVFEEDYKILDLEDLERYIKSNKHLPDVPAAGKIEQDGLALGEMNKILLKKIEELTLHLINKNKITTNQEILILAEKTKNSEQEVRIRKLEMIVKKLNIQK